MRLVPLLFLVIFTASCSKKQEESLDVSAALTPNFSAPVQIEKKEEPPKYFYPYAQKRDPFVPLIGGVQGSPSAKSGSDKRSVERGDVGNLELRGILRDRRGKVAMISSSSGEAYTLRSGRVYDKQNRAVSGVSGIIKENSVILITQNRTVKEIPLAKKEPVSTRSGR